MLIEEAREHACGAPFNDASGKQWGTGRAVGAGRRNGFVRRRYGDACASGVGVLVPPWQNGVDPEAQTQQEWWRAPGTWEDEDPCVAQGMAARGSAEQLLEHVSGTGGLVREGEADTGWSARFGSSGGHPGMGLTLEPPQGPAG
jgi:hypothetical protein